MSAGTLYQFVREFLVERGGAAEQADLLSAMQADLRIAARLQQSEGFNRLLWNMRHSGWIELRGSQVSATQKTLRKVPSKGG